MIIHGTTLGYTKLVLTTGFLLESLCPKTIDLTYNAHHTYTAPPGKSGGRVRGGRRGAVTIHERCEWPRNS